MKKKKVYLLYIAFDVVTRRIGAAMSTERALGIELYETLVVRGNSTASPDLIALNIQRRANTVITMSSIVPARTSVFLVNIRRTLAVLSGTDFRQVAFVGRFPAHDATRQQLRCQNHSRLDGSSTFKRRFRGGQAVNVYTCSLESKTYPK